MKICPRCLDVRASYMIMYCQFCGKKMVNTGTIESEEAERRLADKQKGEKI